MEGRGDLETGGSGDSIKRIAIPPTEHQSGLQGQGLPLIGLLIFLTF